MDLTVTFVAPLRSSALPKGCEAVVSSARASAITSLPSVRLIDDQHEEKAMTASDAVPYNLNAALDRSGTSAVVVGTEGNQSVRLHGVQVMRGGHCNAMPPLRLTVELIPVP